MKFSMFPVAVLASSISISAFAVDFPIEYRTDTTEVSVQQIRGEFRVTNNTNSDVSLADTCVQYYFEPEGTGTYNGYIDYADVNGASYRAITNHSSVEFYEHHFNVVFDSSAGILQTGDSVSVQFRTAKSDWSWQDQSNDPSFNPALTTLTQVTSMSVNNCDGIVDNTVNVSGYVSNVNGQYLENALVMIDGVQVTTNSSGHFNLPDTDGDVVVTVNVQGYAEFSRVYQSDNNEDILASIRLLNIDKQMTFNPNTATTITTSSGASISFPVMGGINESLTVSVTEFNAASNEIYSAPGDFSAIDANGNDVVLISQGMLDVQIKGATTGNEYSLANLGPFPIVMPASDLSSAPSQIGLWWYDKSRGKWIEEGVANLVGNKYYGSVSHFTTWNFDYKAEDLACVDLTIFDQSNVDFNNPDHEYTFTVSTSTWAQTRTGTAAQFASDIRFIRVPAGEILKITVENTTTGLIGSHEQLLPIANAFPNCLDYEVILLQSASVSGTVLESCLVDNQPSHHVDVKLFDSNGFLVGSTTTNAFGQYFISAEPGDDYYVEFSSPNTLDSSYGDIDIVDGESRVIDPVLQIDDAVGNSNVNGRVLDATTGSPISGATLSAFPNLNNTTGVPIATTVSDANGFYNFDGLAFGQYTVQASQTDYSSNHNSFPVTACSDPDEIISLVPFEPGFTFILEWNADPRDLDSHLTGPDNAGGRFHVYYSNKDVGDEGSLNIDDTSGFGPETVSTLASQTGVYNYSIHNYTARADQLDTTLSASGATVTVFENGILTHTITILPSQVGNLWNVLTIENGQVTIVNSLTSVSGPGNVQ